MPLIEKAVVVHVLDRSFDAIILTLDLKCRVYMDQLEQGVRFQYDRKSIKKSLAIHWPGKSDPQVISITSEVKLLVTVTDDLPLKVKVSSLTTFHMILIPLRNSFDHLITLTNFTYFLFTG